MQHTKVFIMTFLTVICVYVNAFAAELNYTSNVDIAFDPFTDIVPPVNPEEPEEESGETGTNQPGPLSIDWVPTLKFGESHTVSATKQIYNTTTTQPFRPYVQVSDLRGSGSGWRLDASLSKFTNGSIETLHGAFITLKNGSLNTATVGVEPPVAENPVTLASGGEAAKIAVASDALDAGRGTWVIRWYPVGGNEDVQLIIPALAASAGTHGAIITWILYDAP